MSWKKNICSYLLWGIYTIAVTLGTIEIFTAFFEQGGYTKAYCYPVTGVFYLAAGILVFALYRLLAKKGKTKEVTDAANRSVIMEGILVVAILTAGIFLRAAQMSDISDMPSELSYSKAFFEAAKVTENYSAPQIVHGATYIYLQLLHLTFLFFGNKYLAAVWMQIALQCFTGAFLYFAVRKLAGRISSLIMLGFMMLSPYMINSAMELSPEVLFFVFYSLVLCVIASALGKSRCNPLLQIFIGILVGVCCYFDLSGISLLIFAAGIFWLEREKAIKWWNQRVFIFLWNLIGLAVGWIGAVSLDTLLCGKKLTGVMTAWFQLYQPNSFSIPGFPRDNPGTNLSEWNWVIIMLLFLVMGIFSFWCRRRQESQGIWVASATVLWLLHCFGMLTLQLQGYTYLYLCLAVLAGLGIANIVTSKSVDFIETTPELTENVEMDEEQVSAPSIHFLENPLPLPKKHQAKVLDYRITEIEDNDYDYPVEEDDDFDI